MRIAVAIPTLGRPEVLSNVINRIKLQSRPPESTFIAPVSDKDVSTITFGKRIIRVESERGLCKQRNSLLRAAKDHDIIVFFDDDFVMHQDCLKKIEEEFIKFPNTVLAHGTVVIDGAKRGGISFETACMWADNAELPEERKLSFSTYGLFAARTATYSNNNIKFDERLTSYGWLEDLDFSRHMMKYGECVHINNAIGAHMAHQAGRTSGLRFGYSQVANPLHIASKHIGYTYPMACSLFLKNFMANLFKSLNPEPFIDRRGRLKGNLLAFKDIISNNLRPENIEHL